MGNEKKYIGNINFCYCKRVILIYLFEDCSFKNTFNTKGDMVEDVRLKKNALLSCHPFYQLLYHYHKYSRKKYF